MIIGLLVVPIANCSLHTGSGQRTFHLYKSLAEYCNIDILLMPEYGSDIMVQLFPSWFEERFPLAREIFLAPSNVAFDATRSRVRIISRVNSMVSRLERALMSRVNTYAPDAGSAMYIKELMRRKQYDFIVGRYLPTISRSGALQLVDVPILLDVDDREEKIIESRIYSRTTPLLLKLLLKRQLPEVRSVSGRLLGRCQHLWLASDVDMNETRHESKSVLQNIPFVPTENSVAVALDERSETRECLFVGTFSHRVNREGVLHFVENCWPLILNLVPDAKFRIVGSGGWESIKAKLEKSAGVEVVGAVDDLSSEYRRALFSVIPLFEGSGTKIKMLESLRFFRTVVAHTHAVRGFDELVNMESVLIGNSDQALAEGCIRLLKDVQLARQLGLNGERIVSEFYSYDSFSRSVRQDVSLVLENFHTTPKPSKPQLEVAIK